MASTEALISGFKKPKQIVFSSIAEHIAAFKKFKESIELSVYQNHMLFSLDLKTEVGISLKRNFREDSKEILMRNV